MALKAKSKFTPAEKMAGILTLVDPMGFARVVMGEKLRQEIAASIAAGVPREFKDRLIFTHEQRLMIFDGASYAFWRWRDPDLALGSRKMLMRTSRKTAKTTFSIELKYMWFSVIHPFGMHAEAMLHTPGDKQLAPVENRLSAIIQQSRLMRLMFLNANKSDNIWQFRTGIWWHHRIEGQRVTDAGAGQVGLAAVYMIGDEGAYSRTKPYNERVAVALPDCVEIWCGVPRPGETGPFKRISDNSWAILEAGGKPEWSLHRNPPIDSKMWGQWRRRYHLAANPRYHSDRAWKDLMAGEGWDSTTVITQVLGLEAAGGRSAFPNVVTAPIPYHYKLLTPGDMDDIHRIVDGLQIEQMDKTTWGIFCDYGFNPSPLEMVIAYREENIWYQYARLEGQRLDPYAAAKLIATVDQSMPNLASYICVDVHGQGSGVRSDLISMPEYRHLDYQTRFLPADFHTYMDDPEILVHKTCKEIAKYEDEGAWYCEKCDKYLSANDITPARVQAKQLLTSDLVQAFNYSSRYLLGTGEVPKSEVASWGLVLSMHDVDAVEEFRETVAVQGSNVIKFIGPGAGEGSDHITDAFRCIATAQRAGMVNGKASLGERVTFHNFRDNWQQEESWDDWWN